MEKKRAPNFIYERREIYEIAEYYQLRLEETGRWDEIDLCRHVLERMRDKGEEFKYDLVVCDEVQDFADIQLLVLFRLARFSNGVVLAGDPKQIINPSGFRWEEVRNRFYERGLQVPPLRHLSLNFRSVGSIVRLANALLDLKQQLIGLTGAELREQWKFNGRPPFLLTEIAESKVMKSLAIRGVGRIILVRDKEEQKRLKASLQTELVFTIHEAKGLEFDTVLLWKFSSDRKSASIWRKIRSSDLSDRTQFPHVRHEINLLYVAVTRARNTLFIFDPSSDVWDVPGLRDHLFRTREQDALSEIWQRVSTPEEWEKQGEYFFEREHFSAAAECFKNAGNEARSEVARAFDLQRRGRYEEAGVLFEKNEYMERAAQCYETGGLIERALPLWQNLGAEEKVFLCRIALYEKNGEFEKAGDGWMEQGQADRALENWKKAGANRKLGEWFKGRKKFKEAAESFESAKEYSEAAWCYRKAGLLEKAADLYFRQGNWEEAVPLFRKLRNHVQLLECYLKSKDYYHAALLCERGRAVEQAIRCFEAFAKASQENWATLLAEAGTFEAGKTKLKALKAAVRFSAIGMFDRSAPLLMASGLTSLALSQFTALGNHEKAADCHIILEDYYAAATAIEKTDLPDKWSRVYELLAQFIGPFRQDPNAAHALRKEADACFSRGSNESALARYKALWARDEIRKVYSLLDRDEEGIEWFLRRGMYEDAILYLKGRKGVVLSPDFVLQTTRELTRLQWQHRDRAIRDEAASRLITGALGRGPRKELLETADAFLATVDLSRGTPPDHILDLIKASRNCNALFRLATSASHKKRAAQEGLKSFFTQVEELARQEGNLGLSACCRFFTEGESFEDSLQGLEADSFNFELFAESERHYLKAVNFLAGMKRTEAAAIICRGHRNYTQAARVYEEAGMSLRAAREYQNGGLFEDAIRCYTAGGDERGIAKVYESQGDLEGALAIWRKLGNRREERRLLRKIKPKGEQIDLF